MQHFAGTTGSSIWLAALAVERDGNGVGDVYGAQIIKGPELCPARSRKPLKDVKQRMRGIDAQTE